MTEPTSINKHRRYTKRQKAVAVTAALASSVAAAAEQQGIPERTLGYWMEQPEFAELRTKTREQMAEGSILLANLAQSELSRKVMAGEVEPRDLAFIYGIAIDKGQLLVGQATNRVESKNITNDLSDHERAQLSAVLDGVLEEAAAADAAVDPPGVGAAVRE